MSKEAPKYLSLKATILEWVLSGQMRPGQQIPTEFQLAEQFQMSRQTVRVAINELVYEHVLVRHQGRGTFVAETVRPRTPGFESHRIIAVVTTYITDYIFPSIIQGIESRLSDAGYSIMLFSTDNTFEKEASALESILQRPIDGVIVEPTRSTLWNPNIRRYLTMLANQVPVVTLHSAYVELGVPCVRMDDEQGGILSVRHLQELGHSRIGAIMKVDDMQGRHRARGFSKAHHERKMPLHPDAIQFYTTEDKSSVAEQYAAWLLGVPAGIRPTAVVCYNDEIASELRRHLIAAKWDLPGDLSLVSFDDSQLAELNGLTSVYHPKRGMGVQVADTILKMTIGSPRDIGRLQDVVLTPRLTVRESTAAPGAIDNVLQDVKIRT